MITKLNYKLTHLTLITMITASTKYLVCKVKPVQFPAFFKT